MLCGSGGSRDRLAKAAGVDPSGEMRDKKCMPLWREAHVQLRMLKSAKDTPFWEVFGSFNVQKEHVVVARSTCGSQNVKSTSASEHF